MENDTWNYNLSESPKETGFLGLLGRGDIVVVFPHNKNYNIPWQCVYFESGHTVHSNMEYGAEDARNYPIMLSTSVVAWKPWPKNEKEI